MVQYHKTFVDRLYEYASNRSDVQGREPAVEELLNVVPLLSTTYCFRQEPGKQLAVIEPEVVALAKAGENQRGC
jgi:hypothetical protein